MPQTGLNYPGSSGYGVDSTGRYGFQGTPTPPPANDWQDYGVRDATGKVISIKTGKPWNGHEPNSGLTYTNGMPSTNPAGTVNVPGVGNINPNDPNQRYRAADIVKQPDIAAGETDLAAQFKKAADSAMSGFGDYLKNFQSDLSRARTLTQKATDTGPTEAALTAAQRTYTGDLSASDAAYQAALKAGAANTRGVVQQAQDTLPMYDAAAKAIENQQLASLQGNLSRYKLGTGTPTSLGSAEEQILTAGAANVMLPIEQAKINQRYNILSGLAMPTEQNIAGQNINYAGNFLPGVAGSRYGSSTNLANTIQNLRQSVAGMSTQQAITFLQAQGIPPQIAQQILSGEIGQLGQLSNIESLSRYQGLQDLLGANVANPTGYNTSVPGYPNLSPRYPTGGGRTPVSVGPGGATTTGNSLIDPATGGYRYTPIPGAPGGGPATVSPRYNPPTGDQSFWYPPTGNVPQNYNVNPDGSRSYSGPGADYWGGIQAARQPTPDYLLADQG